jgi:hypothetical protein
MHTKGILIMDDIQKLLEEYSANPKTFANRYKIHQMRYNKNNDSKIYIDTVDSLLQDYYQKYGARKFANIFYVIKNGTPDIKCRYCGKTSALFLGFIKGYSLYCSASCTRKDGTKTSPEMVKQATIKRQEKMKILLADPIRGGEYRRILSVNSTYNNNLPENKEKKSLEMKAKILSGEWTPNITNSWTRWSIRVGDKPFRSSFEAIFFIYENIFKSNSSLEYEKLRIKYRFDNKESIYIVDFIDHTSKNVFEIKPKGLTDGDKNLAKRSALIEWCKLNGYFYNEITEENLISFVNEMQSLNFNHDFILTFKDKYKKLFL